MYQRQGKEAFKKDLGNIRLLLEYLGNPELKFKSIHIAGTNGKGSTAHMLSAVLQQKFKHVALYTSPHYKDFRERIKINSSFIQKKEVIHFVKKHKAFIEKVKPSFFEITVAMAFDYFARKKVDIAIIETGLGGRLDSTNVICPILSIITNISLDHQAMLGNTLKKIAKEKAGIIKRNVPVVIGEYQRAVASVFKARASKLGAKICFASKTFQVKYQSEDFAHSSYIYKRRAAKSWYRIRLNGHGPFQHKNIQTILMAVEVLNLHHNFRISQKAIKEGLLDMKALSAYQGRWQMLGQKPLILADSGHNEGGLHISIKKLKSLNRQIHFVLGFVNDKSLDKLLMKFPDTEYYYFTQAKIPRALDASALQKKAAEFGLKGEVYPQTAKALSAAKRKAAPSDIIFIGGSTFVVAELI